MKRFLLAFRLLIVLALLALWSLPAPVYAAPLTDGRVIFGDSYTLAAGETLDGDLAVFGGSVTVEQDAIVRGDLVVFGGSLTVDGEVLGDVAVVGGDAHLQSHALIHGDLAVMGGTLSREPGAQVNGQITEQAFLPFSGHWAHIFTAPGFGGLWITTSQGWGVFALHLIGRLLLIMAKAIVLAALAGLLMLFAPDPARRVGQAVIQRPLDSGGVGLLTLLALPVLVVLLTITLIGIPLALVLVILLGLGLLFGWLALSAVVGERIAQALNQTWAPPLSAALGALVLYVVAAGANLIPCIGWIVGLAVWVLSLGGVILTRFGTQPYPTTTVVDVSARQAPEAQVPPPPDESASTEEG